MTIRAANKDRSFLSTCGLVLLFSVSAVSSAQGKVILDWAVGLQESGYPTDTPAQIIEATKSESYFVRYSALRLLTQRTGKEAIPHLIQALDDPRTQVRWHAAHLLGTLGDKSGVDRMRQDLQEFAPNNGAPIRPDPNVTDPDEIKSRESRRNVQLYDGLRAARVLAELGQRDGYVLATTMALQGPWAVHRREAVYVLVEIAKADSKILAAEGMDPASVLCAMADSEKQQSVFSTLVSFAQKLRPDTAERILVRATSSPHQSEKMRNLAAFILQKVKAKNKAGEKGAQDSASSCDQ
jgi:hypothetical protein